MFTTVNRNILRWGTPDPEGDWMMFGHLLMGDEGLLLIDPPLVPDLLKMINRLGRIDAVMLTTLDHTRGARYIAEKTGADLYIPDLMHSKAFDPDEILRQKGIKNFSKYGEEKVYGISPLRVTVEAESGHDMPYMDEFALLTGSGYLIVGDIAIGTPNGHISVAPEWFPEDPPYERWDPAVRKFLETVRHSKAHSLLASHGHSIYGNLQETAERDLQ